MGGDAGCSSFVHPDPSSALHGTLLGAPTDPLTPLAFRWVGQWEVPAGDWQGRGERGGLVIPRLPRCWAAVWPWPCSSPEDRLL